ncbi:uncharacterized protein LOC126921369 isoform X2 [Bombus affinis]|uniref:uncharacterized protein LOC126921369 isoform X2 n=1 Tax=Bombus affinis TaxID=309941 RepID=UPI0021B735B7|nr:uncharacterized protein LOC126921369 isoform X2 [Bombus affinis]
MDKATVVDEYMKVVKICTMIIGIWPDQSKSSKLVMRTIIYIISVLSFVTQIANVVHFFNMNVLLNQICFLTALSGVLLKEGLYIIKATEYKMLLTAIWKDWSTDSHSNEFHIMAEYAKKGALLSWFDCGIGVVCIVVFLQLFLTPLVLDIISPMNETRDLLTIYPAYYYIDDRKYRTIINLHMVYTYILGIIVYVGCDTSYMCIVQHACGQLAVAGHRFKNAIFDLSIVNETSAIQDEIHERVIRSIRQHQYAIDYLKTIQSIHSTYLCICIGLVMVTFSVTLVKVAAQSEISAEFIKDVVFLSSQLTHIFLLTVQGQFVQNANDEVTESIYDALWYNSNNKTKLLFVLALRNCLNPPTLSAAGLIILNLKSFSEILKTSVSYFTVLKST